MQIRSMLAVVGVVVIAVSCAAPVSTPVSEPAERGERQSDLLIGTSSGSPPYATRRGVTLTGLEVDLAIEVGKVLGRPVRFVDLPWDELFGELDRGRIDVVMAGVTITPEREHRYAFTEPYLRTGLAALVRREERKRFGSRDAVCKSPVDVGVVNKTTGESFVRDRCPAMIPRVYQTADDAVLELTTRRIAAVVHDAPVLAYLLSQQGAELDLVPTGRDDQRLAWMLRRDNPALREALNGALTTLRHDGTLDRLLRQWVPQVERARSS